MINKEEREEEMKYRNHKVSMAVWNSAKTFRKVNGFVNPGVVSMVAVCGYDEPMLITKSWDCTTCKRCLRKRKAR